MKGGIYKKNRYPTNEAALKFFLLNCTYKLMSNTTVACITFICRLKDRVASPFIHVRKGFFGNDVQRILVKCFPMTTHPPNVREHMWLDVPGRGYFNGIEITQQSTLVAEFNTQHNVYVETLIYNSLFDGICPAPIDYLNLNKTNFINLIIVNLAENQAFPDDDPTQDPFVLVDDMIISNEIKSTLGQRPNNPIIQSIGIIAMEFMEGYETVMDAMVDHPTRTNDIKQLSKFALEQLHRLNYLHMDFHQGNVMVKLDEEYLHAPSSTMPLVPMPLVPMPLVPSGRVILIDFGRCKNILQDPVYHFLSLRTEPNRLDAMWNLEISEWMDDVVDYSYNVFKSVLDTEVTRYLGSIPPEKLAELTQIMFATTAAVDISNPIVLNPPPPPQQGWRGWLRSVMGNRPPVRGGYMKSPYMKSPNMKSPYMKSPYMKSPNMKKKLNSFSNSFASSKSSQKTKMLKIQEKTTFDLEKFTNNKNVDEIIDLFGEQMKQLLERKIGNTNKEKPIMSLLDEPEETLVQHAVSNVGGRNKTNKRKGVKKTRKTKKRN